MRRRASGTGSTGSRAKGWIEPTGIRMKRSLYIVFVACALFALGWLAYGWQRASKSIEFVAGSAAPTQASAMSASSTPSSDAPTVEVGRAEVMALSSTVAAVGSLRAAESVTVRPEISGRIARIGFEGGDEVQRGDLLVALDASIAAAEAEQTRAELSLARSNHQRTVDLARRNFVSASARDTTAANLQVLEAKLKLAQARLAKSEIRAPFGGVLGLRNVSPGDFVDEGASLVVLEDVSSMKIDFRLPERYLGQIAPGQKLQVEFDAWPRQQFEAVVMAIDVQVDVQGRAVTVRGSLPNPDRRLRTGMFAKTNLTLSENPRALMVPEAAIMPVGNETFVLRIVDDKAIRTVVRTGQRRDGRVEIVEGLQPRSLVVTAGHLKIQRDGQAVRIAGEMGVQEGQSRQAAGATAAPANAVVGGG